MENMEKINKPSFIKFALGIMVIIFGTNLSWLSIFYFVLNTIDLIRMIILLIIGVTCALLSLFLIIPYFYDRILFDGSNILVKLFLKKEISFSLNEIESVDISLEGKKKHLCFFDKNDNVIYSSKANLKSWDQFVKSHDIKAKNN